MNIKIIKIIFAIAVILSAIFAAWSAVRALTPPTIPVLYYGTASVNGVAATSSPIITMRRKTDSLEIASTTAAATGKYFMEVPCSDYVGQTFIFRINDLIAEEANCVDVAYVARVNLSLNFNSADQTVENSVSSITIPSSVSDSQETEIHFTAVATSTATSTVTIGSDGLILERDSLTAANKFIVTFASSTVITGDSSWDGTLIAPSISNVSLSIPADAGMVSQANKIINIGFTGQSLTFDKPVSILFPGQAGNQIGFSRNSSDFTEITVICPDNSINSLTATTAQECKFNGPSDLTVWTKHFTYFAVYHQAVAPAPSSSGGGGSYYYQQTQSSATTTATTAEPSLIATSTPAAEEPAIETPVITPQILPQVLAVKYYANGTLIRGQDKKIYLIQDDKLIVIRTLTQLKKYKAQKIYDVPDEVIRQYIDFTDGQLIRGSDKKIYVIAQGKKKLIKNLEELKQYNKQKINDVSLEILAKFPLYTVKPGLEYFANGSLIRGHDKKIYLIQNNKLVVIRTVAQLNKYKAQKIYDVPDEVIRQYMNFFDGQLIRGSSQKIYIIKNHKKQPILSLAELKKYAGRPIYDVSDEILRLY
ncbi:MAG: hypothetical protein PHF50_03350 [Patescibacteria group bacterium]|nr:hypothetical protein [Patescibacteria group bacterium]